MRQVATENGTVIDGLYRNTDGSLSLNNFDAFKKNKLQHEKFATLTSEVCILREQVNKILEQLNGS